MEKNNFIDTNNKEQKFVEENSIKNTNTEEIIEKNIQENKDNINIIDQSITEDYSSNQDTIKEIIIESNLDNNCVLNGETDVKNTNIVENNSEKIFQKKDIIPLIITCALGASIGGVIGASIVLKNIEKNQVENKPVIMENVLNFTDELKPLTVTQAVKKVAPAVVSISTKSITSNFFTTSEKEGLGSGFIISEKGHIVTNYHVLSDAQDFKVILSTGEEVEAKIINYDERKDIALLKIIDEEIVMPGIAELGDSDILQAGEDVIAIGNPLGKEYSQTVTKGIISSPKRNLELTEGIQEDYIQTDAAINPGNSGGPLINSLGQVVGINVAKQTGYGVEGIGLSIPINVIKENMDTLSKPILVLGVTVRNVTKEQAKKYNLVEGIYIIEVAPFSSAEKAGFKPGDVMTKFNKKTVKTIDDMDEIKKSLNEGDTIDITVVRNKKEIDLKLTLES